MTEAPEMTVTVGVSNGRPIIMGDDGGEVSFGREEWPHIRAMMDLSLGMAERAANEAETEGESR